MAAMWWADHGTTGIKTGVIHRHAEADTGERSLQSFQIISSASCGSWFPTGGSFMRLQHHPGAPQEQLTPRGCRPGWASGTSWLAKPESPGKLGGSPDGPTQHRRQPVARSELAKAESFSHFGQLPTLDDSVFESGERELIFSRSKSFSPSGLQAIISSGHCA
ncbi:unnamed protein product [Polarella glacialis]|uniref:Uncharacterized protein n=1 Tax=Polarella glacialis TaxID=89957 RepID=A0A813K3C0_POLGL|nr:unnamed protein product [Polarella glacialis]